MSHSPFRRSHYDVIIAGARVAGAATAMLLARSGLSVLVVDQGERGTDTRSTHALMRGGATLLARWGVLDDIVAAATPPVRRVTFHYGDRKSAVELRPGPGFDALYAPRRTLLDERLVVHAERAGAEVHHRVRLLNVLRTGDRVTGVVVQRADGTTVGLRARWIVGADGIGSAVARKVGARTELAGANASAVLYGYWKGLNGDGYHWHMGHGAAAGVIPTNDNCTCVFVSMKPDRFRRMTRQHPHRAMTGILEEAAPELARRLATSPAVAPLTGFAGIPGYFRQAWGPGWSLVGDAGYFKDPITAHGITDALRDASLLSRALIAGDDASMSDYQRTRDDLSRELFWISDELASYEWDLARAEALHLALARAMKREVAHIESQIPTLGRQESAPRSGIPVDLRSARPNL